MQWYENSRPFVVTVLMALVLPVPPYLLLLHGLQNVWRRIGFGAYVVLLTAYGLMVWGVISMHAVWPWAAGAWPPAVAALSLVPLATAAVLAVITYVGIEPGTLHLARQIAPHKGRHLITTGILGRIRHPRYVMFSLLALGNALATGYPLAWMALAVTLAGFWGVIRLEERELAAYFGEPFLAYRRQVPAFIPRFFGRKREASGNPSSARAVSSPE